MKKGLQLSSRRHISEINFVSGNFQVTFGTLLLTLHNTYGGNSIPTAVLGRIVEPDFEIKLLVIVTAYPIGES